MPLPVPRRYSKIEVPIHFIWATAERRPLLTPEVERIAYRIIQTKAQQLEATVLALNGMPDHVHLAVLFTPNVSIASFIRQLKRSVTVAIRQQYGESLYFEWEPGYAAFGFPFGKRQVVMDYIRNQKMHHDNGKLIAYWEEIGEWRDGKLQPTVLVHAAQL